MKENITSAQICRLCLATTKIYIYFNQSENVCQILKSLTLIEIDPNDEFSVICYKCRLNLNLAYYIQQKMIKAEETFRQNFSSFVIKEEIDCDDFIKVESKDDSQMMKKEKLSYTYCKICDRDYPNRKTLILHQRDMHVMSKCRYCDVRITKRNMPRHVKKEHRGLATPKEKPTVNKCDICSKNFPTYYNLSRHKKIHEKVKCPECSRRIYESELSKHLQIAHSIKKDSTVSKPEVFKCNICDRKYESERLLDKHVTSHKQKNCSICDKPITVLNLYHHMKTHTDSAQLICELCGALLKNKASLRAHIYLVHRGTQYKCKYCDKTFISKTNKNLHEIKDHLHEANFVCDICGKKFYSKGYLKRHVDMKHLKLRPFECDLCKNSFSSRFAMRTHRRIHTNETPYKCDECGEGFRQKVSLRNHLKSKHDVKEEIRVFCKVCGKGFASEVALYSHQRGVHE